MPQTHFSLLFQHAGDMMYDIGLEGAGDYEAEAKYHGIGEMEAFETRHGSSRLLFTNRFRFLSYNALRPY